MAEIVGFISLVLLAAVVANQVRIWRNLVISNWNCWEFVLFASVIGKRTKVKLELEYWTVDSIKTSVIKINALNGKNAWGYTIN